MIIYQNTRKGFLNDTNEGNIANKIKQAFEERGFHPNNVHEYQAWHNSLLFMANVLNDQDIPEEATIAIEYKIPLTSKRVDFLIAGKDENNQSNILVIELKQWQDSEITDKPDIVKTHLANSVREVCHPSYQAYSYAKTIENFNEEVSNAEINLVPCAFLHNYSEKNRSHIDNDFYLDAINAAPLFLEEDTQKLRSFIKSFIHKKDGEDLLMKIDYGKLKPAKALQDSLKDMLKGNEEFILIDEQKVAYETIQKLVDKAVKNAVDPKKGQKKSVVIVTGGAGTGKSVIAIQLLCHLIQKGYSAAYVTKNKAPRDVYFQKLRQNNFRKNYIQNLFKASDWFWDKPENSFDCLLIDEAHRLRKKSQIFRGENQVKELIKVGRVTVFFLDENQQVITKDIGSKQEIRQWAKFHGAELHEGADLKLISQFRCNGSDGYIQFLDCLLKPNPEPIDLFDLDYDLKLFDSPVKMREALREKNAVNNKSRMVAGYCYEWDSKEKPNGDQYDIVLEDGFKAKWNFANKTFAIDPDSFDQVGCIHTTQGLEFDYCGVIIGQDLRYEGGHVITDQSKVAKSDNTSGIRTCKDKKLADQLIRNTYKTLLSRGQKGTYIYCEDKELLKHMAEMLNLQIIY